MFIVGDEKSAWMALLQCPCGCGDAIHLSLVTDGRPSWRVRTHRNGCVTSMPSVWRTTGCRRHFIVYRAYLLWCKSHPDDEHVEDGPR